MKKDRKIRGPSQSRCANGLEEIGPVSKWPQDEDKEDIDREPDYEDPDPELLDPIVITAAIYGLSAVDHHCCGKELGDCLAQEDLCFRATKSLWSCCVAGGCKVKKIGWFDERRICFKFLRWYGAAIAALALRFRRILRRIGRRCERGWWAQQSERSSFFCYKA